MELNKNITCAFTGKRPQNLPWKFNEEDERCKLIKEKTKIEIENAVKKGYKNFITGMALGFDTYVAEILLELKQQYELKLICVIPCKTQDTLWSQKDKKRYHDILSKADYIHCISETYTSWCMQKRNEYMVDNSSLLIALFDGKSGGTKNTIDYATNNGVETIVINPLS